VEELDLGGRSSDGLQTDVVVTVLPGELQFPLTQRPALKHHTLYQACPSGLQTKDGNMVLERLCKGILNRKGSVLVYTAS